jgi:hypothetical protein
MKPSGAHTHPELRGSGGGNGWLILVGAIILAAVAGPIARAISDLIEALAITVAVLLAIAGLAIVLASWIRHKHARLLTQRGVRTLQAPAPPAPTAPTCSRSWPPTTSTRVGSSATWCNTPTWQQTSAAGTADRTATAATPKATENMRRTPPVFSSEGRP